MIGIQSWFSSVSSSGSDGGLDGPKNRPFDGPASSSSLPSLSCFTAFGKAFLLTDFKILDCCNQSGGQGRKKVMPDASADLVLTDARTPFPNPDWPPFWGTLPSLYARHGVLGGGMFL